MREILSAAVAALLFLGSYLFLEIPLLPSLVVSAVALTGAFIFFTRKKSVLEQMGFDMESINQKLKNAKEKVGKIEDLSREMNDDEPREVILSIIKSATATIETLKKDPTNINSINKFFGYYLDTTIKILESYTHIEDTPNLGEQTQKLLLSSKETFKTLDEAFKKFNEKLLSNKTFELETELSLLQKTIKSEL